MPQRRSPWTGMLDALGESNKAIFDAIKSGRDRGYRVSRRLVSEAESAQKEIASLRRRFARGPKDPRSLYQTAVDLARRAGNHSAELGKEVLASAGDARREAQDTLSKVVAANRSAGRAMAAGLQGAARQAASRAGRALPARRRARRAAPARGRARGRPAAARGRPTRTAATRRRTTRTAATRARTSRTPTARRRTATTAATPRRRTPARRTGGRAPTARPAARSRARR